MELKLFDNCDIKIHENHDNLYNFFLLNKDLFKNTKNGENKSNQHKKFMNILKEEYSIDFPYGKCFPISQFLFYYLGGYNSNYILKCIKKIPIKIKNETIYTSHWYVQHKYNGEIFDLTKSQFDKILNIENYYKLGKRANYGFKWLKKNGKKYNNVVPCNQVLILYKKFRETNYNKNLEFYYEEWNKLK